MPRNEDPSYLSFRFVIEIDGITEGGFTDVTGLQATTQVEEYREGGLNDYVHKFRKETTYENLILKKGVGDSLVLWQWHRDVVVGKKIDRKQITIKMLKHFSNTESAREWSVTGAFPVKWIGPELKADTNTVAFETLEIAHHGFI